MHVSDANNKSSVEQVTTFLDANPSWSAEVPATMPPMSTTFDNSDATLNNFFSRPIRIASYTWNINTDLYQLFDPWTLYWENAVVKKKIANYALMRCKMHISVKVSGGPFHYGSLLMHYHPFTITEERDYWSTNSGVPTNKLIQGSQLPHLYIDPTESAGGDMTLPFLYHKNYFDLIEKEYSKAGYLVIQTLNTLHHANAANDPVTVQIYAWAEEVEFGIPTLSEPNYVAQSGIGSSIKAFVGSFRPNQPVPSQVHRTWAGNLSGSDVPDSSAKLSVKSDQNVMSACASAGMMDSDGLNIVALGKHESYLTSFTWETGDTPNTHLFSLLCNPMLGNTTVLADRARSAITLTPSGFASLPFEYWHGTMEIRLQVVASKYHRGRLKIVYDPKTISAPSGTADNVAYNAIIDLAETRDITFKVPWGKARHWLRVLNPSVYPYGFLPFSTSREFIPDIPELCNGQVGVFVINELTAPNSTVNNDVSVNIYTRMCDDFCVSNPSSTRFQDLVFQPGPAVASTEQSIEPQFVEQADMSNASSQTDAPMSTSPPMDLGGIKNSTDHFSVIYPGENVTSLYDLLRRYNYHTTVGQVATINGNLRVVQNAFPYFRGAPPDAIGRTSSNQPYNFCQTTMLNYCAAAFMGYKGSIRWKVVPDTISNNNQALYAGRVEADETNIYSATFAPMASTTAGPSLRAQNGAERILQPPVFSGDSYNTSLTGMTVSRSDVSPLELEIPYYSQDKYYIARDFRKCTSPLGRDNWWHFSATLPGGSNNYSYNTFCSIGDDFSFIFFLGSPLMYYDPGRIASPTL
jgi:hypothetical protein